MVFSTDPSIIKVAGCITDSSVDGPGMRYVIFFQGCHHGCPGCHNPATHSWDCEGVEEVPVDFLVEHFKENAVAKRVTISGGEPFGQPHALLNLVQKLSALGVRDIWVYTGYTYKELCGDEMRVEILKYCDTAVTGRYMKMKKEGAPLFAGSSNQEIVKLKEVLAI